MTPVEITSFRGDYFFLSNFSPATFSVDGLAFPTTEHAYQAFKAATREGFEMIRNAPTARDAKHFGKDVQLRLGWEQMKETVMLLCLRAKFGIPELRAKLLATGNAKLVEGNTWHDRYWGKCGCQQHKGAGYNRLGELLMQVRAELRAETR